MYPRDASPFYVRDYHRADGIKIFLPCVMYIPDLTGCTMAWPEGVNHFSNSDLSVNRWETSLLPPRNVRKICIAPRTRPVLWLKSEPFHQVLRTGLCQSTPASLSSGIHQNNPGTLAWLFRSAIRSEANLACPCSVSGHTEVKFFLLPGSCHCEP